MPEKEPQFFRADEVPERKEKKIEIPQETKGLPEEEVPEAKEEYIGGIEKEGASEDKRKIEETKIELKELMAKPTIEILNEKAKKIENEIKEISPEEKERLIDSVVRISKKIPEAIFTGGTALRIYIENLNKKVPTEFGKDIDCIMKKETYEKIRDTLPPQRGKELVPAHPTKPLSIFKKIGLRRSFRRKGNEEETPFGIGDFLKDPENHMALEDKKTYYHIDIFPKQEITSEVNTLKLRGQKINLLSSEELFVRRMSQIQRGIEEEKLQSRHINYFYLNGGLIDERKMDNLWEKIREQKKDVKDWREIWLELDKGIDFAKTQGKIKEEIIH